jgi:excisionase family DNA binding protein
LEVIFMTDSILMPGYIPTSEAAKRLGVTAARIRQLIKDGKLVASKISPQIVFVTEQSVSEYAGSDRTSGRKRKAQTA